MFAKTEFVMMLDVDFVPCTDFRGFLNRAFKDDLSNGLTKGPEEYFMKRLRNGTAALVIPAFEYVKQKDGMDQSRFPTDKAVSSSLQICGGCLVIME
jgi:N-acetyllactosaminide beta-1,3-N-acetylglucosaminyltransferase/glycosyltransferase-like protein LARGE